ncbi:substrate-binding domain-containing protein, partial [Pseudomonas sp.]|uniref:substrate-binding domain-containing protein n=1 Tax=Pseudomonas sp. TaxID=306 RepID=UPI003D6F59DF
GITALAQPTDAIGATAFDCLLRRLRGDTEPTRTLDFLPELIIRGSTQSHVGAGLPAMAMDQSAVY